MRAILDAHVAEPGLAVAEIAAADDATAFAIQDLLTEPLRHRQTGRPEIQASRASGCGASSTYASAPTHSPIPSSVQAGRATGRNLKRTSRTLTLRVDDVVTHVKGGVQLVWGPDPARFRSGQPQRLAILTVN
jgi:hypothetical protein